MDKIKKIAGGLLSCIATTLIMILPFGIVYFGKWISDKISALPSINESVRVNENVRIILKRGNVTKAYNTGDKIRWG